MQILIDVPENYLDVMHCSREDFLREAKLAMAVKFFEMKRLSSGMAAMPLCWNGVRVTVTSLEICQTRISKKIGSRCLTIDVIVQLVRKISSRFQVFDAQGSQGIEHNSLTVSRSREWP
jgi:hypothetical protein